LLLLECGRATFGWGVKGVDWKGVEEGGEEEEVTAKCRTRELGVAWWGKGEEVCDKVDFGFAGGGSEEGGD